MQVSTSAVLSPNNDNTMAPVYPPLVGPRLGLAKLDYQPWLRCPSQRHCMREAD